MDKQENQSNSKVKLVIILILLGILITISQHFPIQKNLQNSLAWVKNLGNLAPIIFIIIYNLATIFLIPGSILTLGGGFLFGIFWGSVYVFIAATIGATFAFIIGRYLTRDWVYKQIEKRPKFQAIDQAVAKEGWKIVFLTRLSPVFPFNLLNYAFGITQVSLRDYILGSVGMIPGTIMYVYIGSLAGSIATIGTSKQPINSTLEWTVRTVGFLATVAVTIYVTHIAKKALEDKVG
jgi:uncharacterized membrane protein YdjX (TVP38/TMEM64 family)